MNILVNLHKVNGITSHDAVTAVKKLFKVKKAGHAGTLDPIATGVMLVCLNEATKITGLLSDLDKEYIMTAKLGECTDTFDSEGKVTKRFENGDLSSRVQSKDIQKVIQNFIGEIEQIPPMYSAIKLSGQPLYKLARRGIEVERKPRMVTVKEIEIKEYEPPFLKLRISCSKGTYIRSLCNDIGEALGVGAYITELRRTRTGNFKIEDSALIEELPDKVSALHSVDASLKHLPEIILAGSDVKRAKNGNPVSPIPYSHFASEDGRRGFIRLKDPEGRLFGIGRISKDLIKIERLLNL